MKILLRWLRVPSTLVYLVLLLAGVGFLLSNSLRLWIFTVDDAYITFRYSANLANGTGPTFNPQPPRAEGYTSALWMAVMAVPHLLRFGVISFAKLGGMLGMLGAMVALSIFLWQAGRVEDRGYRLAAAGLACLFFGMLPETAVHAVSGMETGGYVFLLTLLALLSYLGMKDCRLALDWLPLAALLAGLMRPEANLLAVLALASAGWRLPHKQLHRFLLRCLLLYVLPGLVYFLWRWSYFGVLLPLPFYIKTSGSGLPGWGMVSAFGLFALSNLGLYLGIGLFGERRAVGLLLLLALPDLLFFLFSYPIMEYDYRFVYPLLPLLLALAGMGLELLLAQMDQMAKATLAPSKNRYAWLTSGTAGTEAKASAALAPLNAAGTAGRPLAPLNAAGTAGRALAPLNAAGWIGLLALVVFASQNLPRTGELIAHKLEYAQGMLRNHVTIGQTLAQAAAQTAQDGSAPVLAVSDAGAMPYYSGWRTVDIRGLKNETNLALQRVPAEVYIFEQNPDVLVLTSNDAQEFQKDSAFGQQIYRMALERGLEVVVRSPFYQGDSIWVLARPGSAAAQALKARFPAEK